MEFTFLSPTDKCDGFKAIRFQFEVRSDVRFVGQSTSQHSHEMSYSIKNVRKESEKNEQNVACFQAETGNFHEIPYLVVVRLP